MRAEQPIYHPSGPIRYSIVSSLKNIFFQNQRSLSWWVGANVKCFNIFFFCWNQLFSAGAIPLDMKRFFFNFRTIARSTNSIVLLAFVFYFLRFYNVRIEGNDHVVLLNHFSKAIRNIGNFSQLFLIIPQVNDNVLLLWRADFSTSCVFQKLL